MMAMKWRNPSCIACMALSFFLFFCSIPSAHFQTVQRIIIPNQIGRCLDGSPPGYYLRKGYSTGANNWIIYFEGGGWCFNEKECRIRARRREGSSVLRTNLWFGGGILSKKKSENPDFYNWNVVYAFYCDGAAFAGTKGAVKTKANNRIFFSGHFNLESIVRDLVSKRNLLGSTRVLVTGCSAGGHTVAFGCNYIANALPHSNVKCIVDGGLFPDAKDVSGGFSFRKKAKGLFFLQKMAGGVDSGCRRDNRWAQWKCFFPQNQLLYVKVPVFIVNSVYDPASLSIVFNKGGKLSRNFRNCLYSPNFSRCPRKLRHQLLAYGSYMGKLIRSIVRKRRKSRVNFGSFIMDYPTHCTTIYSSWNRRKPAFMRYGKWRLGRPSLRTAIGNWALDR